jgi:hypothetical protein
MPTTVDGDMTAPLPVTTPPTILLPPEPPPPDGPRCPPGCLLEGLTQAPSPTSVPINIFAAHTSTSDPATLPDFPTFINSVTHVVCSPRVCGIHSDKSSSITVNGNPESGNRMVDGGSNVCVTGDLGCLVDVTDINPITILVALEGGPASYNDCITKRGLTRPSPPNPLGRHILLPAMLLLHEHG